MNEIVEPKADDIPDLQHWRYPTRLRHSRNPFGGDACLFIDLISCSLRLPISGDNQIKRGRKRVQQNVTGKGYNIYVVVQDMKFPRSQDEHVPHSSLTPRSSST